MIFIINQKKYDTSKMEKIADVKKWYSLDSWVIDTMFGRKDVGRIFDCQLWRSEKGNWLLTSERDYMKTAGEAITEDEAKSLLMKFALDVYESMYGSMDEA